MPPVPTAAQVESLYKATLQAANRFASYNFRNHFVRRADEVFQPVLASLGASSSSSSSSTTTSAPSSTSASRSIPSNPMKSDELAAFYEDQAGQLEVLKRAAEVNVLFKGPKLVVEHPKIITGGGGAGMEASTSGTSKLE